VANALAYYDIEFIMALIDFFEHGEEEKNGRERRPFLAEKNHLQASLLPQDTTRLGPSFQP
jgi:hypothetical protein